VVLQVLVLGLSLASQGSLWFITDELTLRQVVSQPALDITFIRGVIMDAFEAIVLTLYMPTPRIIGIQLKLLAGKILQDVQ